jgi:aminopeptidase
MVGEVAFGLNYEIDRFTRNILLDEKIGGTMHLALGAGFAQAGGANTSALHWDMICDLRAEGEVLADGELVWKDGSFVAPLDVAVAGERG